ncbi:hypothetical protein BC835DRAFT_1360055 [Cytidiella melzeri]|nr:hypothetical protein BC835DRAFT_1360055 [Cytidiella melzeri]
MSPRDQTTSDDSAINLRRLVQECVRSITPIENIQSPTKRISSGASTAAHTSVTANISTSSMLKSPTSKVDLERSITRSLLKPGTLSRRRSDTVRNPMSLSRTKSAQRSHTGLLRRERNDELTFDAYIDHLKVLEEKQRASDERALRLEQTNLHLEGEMKVLKEQLKRVNTVLEIVANVPLISGYYKIVNASSRRELCFPENANNPHRSVLSSRFNSDDQNTQLWHIDEVDDQTYTIQNVRMDLYANSWKFSGPGDKVVGAPEGREFHVFPTNIEGQYTISSTDSPNLLWTLDDDEHANEVILTETTKDVRQRWTFEQGS